MQGGEMLLEGEVLEEEGQEGRLEKVGLEGQGVMEGGLGEEGEEREGGGGGGCSGSYGGVFLKG